MVFRMAAAFPCFLYLVEFLVKGGECSGEFFVRRPGLYFIGESP